MRERGLLLASIGFRARARENKHIKWPLDRAETGPRWDRGEREGEGYNQHTCRNIYVPVLVAQRFRILYSFRYKSRAGADFRILDIICRPVLCVYMRNRFRQMSSSKDEHSAALHSVCPSCFTFISDIAAATRLVCLLFKLKPPPPTRFTAAGMAAQADKRDHGKVDELSGPTTTHWSTAGSSNCRYDDDFGQTSIWLRDCQF